MARFLEKAGNKTTEQKSKKGKKGQDDQHKQVISTSRFDFLHQACDDVGLTITPYIYVTMNGPQVAAAVEESAREVVRRATVSTGSDFDCCAFSFK